ncbi:MAG: hypothetical protein KW788_03680 [Candidatus Doudnabacteria bacterium]|nr:hypothetical protein [Candidatus Doudnabacteria bacterium]
MSDDKWAEKLAEKVEPEQRTEFIRFVTAGESSPEFQSHLDSCQACQAAVEEAVQITSRGLERLAETLAADRNK